MGATNKTPPRQKSAGFNYAKAYKETVAELYLTYESLGKQEDKIDYLFALMDQIDAYKFDLELAMKSMNDQAKARAFQYLRIMIQMFQLYGRFCFDEIAARRQVFLQANELAEAYEVIRQQKAEIESLKNSIEFEKETQ